MKRTLVAEKEIVAVVLSFYPDAQAVYLFGSYGTEYERDESDVDLAILLPHDRARRLGNLGAGLCASALADLLDRSVDLVNLRLADTVFQLRIIETGRRLHAAGDAEAASFEMLTLSLYQKLNEERSGILEDIIETGRIFAR